MSKIKRKSENGGNINGAVQIEGRSVEAAKRRGPKSKFSEVLFERVWRRVAGGEGLMASIKAEGMGASRFYECVARKPELAAALQKAREQGSAPVLRRAGGTTPVLRSSNDTEDGEGGLQPLRQGSTLHPLRLRRGREGYALHPIRLRRGRCGDDANARDRCP